MKDVYEDIMDTEEDFKRGFLLQKETGVQVDAAKVSSLPRLRGGNAELFECRVYDGSDPYPGKLKYIISKETIESLQKAKRNP